MRRLLAVLVAFGLLVAPTSAQSATELRAEGAASSVIEFEVPARTQLTDPALGRRPAGTTTGGFVGYYIQQLPDLKPMVGFVTFPAVNATTIPLVEHPDATLEPGRRYRMILLADGPSTVTIPTTGAGVVLRPVEPVRVFFTGLVAMPTNGVTTKAFTTHLTRTSLAVQLATEQHSTPAVRGREMCIVPTGTQSCEQQEAPQPVVPPVSPSRVTYSKTSLPGAFRDGDYDLLYRVTSVDPDGSQQVVGLVVETAPGAVPSPAGPADSAASPELASNLPATGSGALEMVALALLLLVSGWATLVGQHFGRCSSPTCGGRSQPSSSCPADP